MNAINSIYAATVSLSLTDMTAAMTNVCKVVEKKACTPALSAVLVRENLGGLEFIGTDMDMTTTRFVNCDAPRGFAATLDAHKALDILKRAKASDTVTMTLTEDGVLITIGKLNLKLNSPVTSVGYHEADILPAFKELAQTNHSFNMPTDLLREAFTKTVFSISTEETRYYLNGIFMTAVDRPGEETELVFVATDGHRLARFTIPAPAGAGAIPDVIIPTKTVKEVLRLVKRKGCPESVMIAVAESGVSFLIGEDELLQSKNIDGTYPDFTRVIPSGNGKRVTVDPAAVRDAVKQISVIASERGRAVRLDFGQDQVTLTVSNPDTGSADITIQCASTIEAEMGVNWRYLDDIMAMIEGHAELLISCAGTPMIINDMADDRVTFVQMPMRI